MGFNTEFLVWFHKGGPVMYPLLLCSVLVVAIGVERFKYYRQACTATKVLTVMEGLIAERRWEDLAQCCMGRENMLERIVGSGIKHMDCPVGMKECFEETTALEATNLRRNLSYLDTVVTMAPLLGLLGTVIGMIGSFRALDIAGNNPAVITGGIGEALIATASGLCVAVMALIVHSYYSHRLDNALTNVENICSFVMRKVRSEG